MINHFNMSQSLISHHLADLRNAGLVKVKKKGRKVYYSLTSKGKAITNIIFSFWKDYNMKIQVLGSGCATCKKLYQFTQEAVKDMDGDYEVEYVTGAEGTQKIIELGALSSPVLAVNNQIAMTGFTPDIKKIQESIRKFL